MNTDGLRRHILVMHALVCALLLRAALRTGSLRFTIRVARVAGSICRTRATIADCVAAGRAAADEVAHATCLYRALTVYALLAYRHPFAQFHIGAEHAGPLATHAWASVGGRPLDSDAHLYARLWTASREG